MRAQVSAFLDDAPGARPWTLPDGARRGFQATNLYLGQGQRNPLEVAVATAPSRPRISDVRNLWNKRHGNRPSPLLLVLLYADRVAVCGPVGPDPAVEIDLDPGQVERIATAALSEPDRHAAIRLLQHALPEATSELPGIRNVGMFATHELREGVPTRPDWTRARDDARRLLSLRGRQLIEAMGFTVETHGAATSLLIASGRKRAVAVFLDESETPEAPASRFGGVDPVSHALAAADREGLPFVVVTRGGQIRLYSAEKDVGVGRKGPAETFIEINLALLPDELAGYLPLIFGADALHEEGTFWAILEDSRNFAAGLGRRLRDRVYEHVVPALASAVANQFEKDEPDEGDLRFLYEEALTILFRLLFIAYAEDKNVLPLRTNGRYQQHALKTLARDLAERRSEGEVDFDPKATDLWATLLQLFKAVNTGNRDWGVPGYDGGLFTTNPEISEVGEHLSGLELTNAEIGPALLELLVDEGDEGYGPVDFRSLSVREFGTIYEGLLESDIAIAPSDLTLDANNTYVPASHGDEVKVEKGSIYLRNRSGARKTSGSYFTKPFAVEHLLDHSLEPTLEEHIRRLADLVEGGEEAEATEAFFDFRVADIAMGSGHFLVAAVDRIERRLSGFLAEHPVPGVMKELERLRASALGTLGEHGEGQEIEHASLLRRQVARRCVYGVDINRIAVELARLAVWVHTFVPGLPLTFLDHNLVVGNSLTGIGGIDEAVRILDPDGADGKLGTVSIFRDQILGWLRVAEDSLRRLARISEATKQEIDEARRVEQQAREAVEPVHVLFDLLVAVRLGEVPRLESLQDETVLKNSARTKAEEIAEEVQALHFPIAFPEVFLSPRGGFDCIIGNPPWDKVRFEPQQFWVSRAPGLNAVPARDRPQAIEKLRSSRPADAALERVEQAMRERFQQYIERAFRFQGRGQHGHHDLAKVFVERAMDLLADRGHLAYVLPRVSLVLGGWTDLRRRMLEGHRITALQARNRAGWLFEDIDFRLMIVLLTRGPTVAGQVPGAVIWPSVASVGELQVVSLDTGFTLSEAEIGELTDRLVLPWFNGPGDLRLFEKMLSFPRLGRRDGWITGTADSARWDFSGTGRHRSYATAKEAPGAWRVLMTRHVLSFGIDWTAPFQRFIERPEILADLELGVELRAGSVVVSSNHPLIVYRYPTMNDNTRTLIATALPEAGVLPSKGYVHGILHPEGTKPESALALLGYLNSFTCDWWVRRFVDRHLTLPVLTNIPLPNWASDQVQEAAGLTLSLLARRGADRLAGGYDVREFASLRHLEEPDLLARLEHLVLRGFALNPDALESFLEDFSDEACPTPIRAALFKEKVK